MGHRSIPTWQLDRSIRRTNKLVCRGYVVGTTALFCDGTLRRRETISTLILVFACSNQSDVAKLNYPVPLLYPAQGSAWEGPISVVSLLFAHSGHPRWLCRYLDFAFALLTWLNGTDSLGSYQAVLHDNDFLNRTIVESAGSRKQRVLYKYRHHQALKTLAMCVYWRKTYFVSQ